MSNAYALYDEFADSDNFESFNKKKHKKQKQQSGLKLTTSIKPKTYAQEQAFTAWYQGYNLMLHGCAGTGKTFIALYLSLQELMAKNCQNITIVRSVVPTRDMGFLPGNMTEKAKAYEGPYFGIFTDLFGRGDAYEILKNKQQVKFETTSFIRGMTFDNSIIVVDECQNLTFHELDSIITRVGEDTRIIFAGDYTQSDFRFNDEKQGIKEFLRILDRMKQFDLVEFQRQDIVRSGLVKDYICTKLDLNIQ